MRRRRRNPVIKRTRRNRGTSNENADLPVQPLAPAVNLVVSATQTLVNGDPQSNRLQVAFDTTLVIDRQHVGEALGKWFEDFRQVK